MAKSRNILMGAGAGIVFATVVAMFLSGRADLPEGMTAGQTDSAAPANTDAVPAIPAEAPAQAAATDTQSNTQAAAPAPQPEAEVTSAESTSPEAAEPEVAAADTTPADGTDATILFDLVRVEPNGATLVAGSAPAGAGLAILVDGVRVATADAGTDGKFASFLDLPPAPRARVLTLAKLDGQQMGAQGNQRVILAPVIVEPEVAETAPEATTDAPDQPVATETATTAPEAPADSAPLPIASDAPGAPTVLLADDKGMRVLQPGGSAPEVMEQVALDVISYDAEGEVNLAGRGTGEGHVRVYVDNEPVITTAIDQNGGWQVQLPQINSGDYTLRVDEIAVDGSVASRLETPFRRESAEVLADAPRDASGAVTATVTPGSTLWAIAEGKYGDGLLYVRVFEANRDKIRNPDLIYPGQIFDLPNE